MTSYSRRNASKDMMNLADSGSLAGLMQVLVAQLLLKWRQAVLCKPFQRRPSLVSKAWLLDKRLC